MESVWEAAIKLKQKYPLIHVFINNAAVYKAHRTTVAREYETMFAVNQLGPFLLTNLLLDNLKAAAPSRILNVTAPSTTKLVFDDLQGVKKFNALKAFGASKMANLLFTYELARRLEGTGVTANAYFPGLMKSKLPKEMAPLARFFFGVISKPPEQAAEGLLYMGRAPELEKVSGKMYKYRREMRSNVYSHDPVHQRRLWDECARLAGLQ
jgi:NAD(P)-dependent dehydrogenase (short-subunit alcohol dehydrogenase family)